MEVPLTPKEQDAVAELSAKQDLSPERVMIQGFRLYQLVVIGGAKVEMPDNGLRLAPPWEQPIYCVRVDCGPYAEFSTVEEAKSALWEFAQHWPAVSLSVKAPLP